MEGPNKKSWISLEDIKKNFMEERRGMPDKEAIDEANRCLYCYDAPCITACPTGIDIPKFIKRISTGDLKGSSKTIMEANPVGASCSRVCPTEELCEGACVLNHASAPIMIGDLQRYATDWAMKNEQEFFKKGESLGKNIAVVGGGPAGLSAARELARFGYEVTIFEAKEKAGGLNTYGIVSFRLPQKISAWEVDQVEKLGVKIKTGVKVGKDVSAEELQKNYDAVVLAAGMSKVPALGIKGETSKDVYDAIDFVEKTKTEELTNELSGKRVAVIGAGNTAVDAATCAKRLGAELVKMVYRRTEKEMTAYQFEYEFAKQDGIEFSWLTSPLSILEGPEGEVKGLECIKMELGKPDEGGRRRPVPIPGTEFIMEVDVVIKAIGQTRHLSLIEQFGLSHDEGVVIVDHETMTTSKEGVFAAGDVVFGNGQGEAMVVTAAEQGKKAAYNVHKKLINQSVELLG
ncbi:NAD(P)-dependent oxidoreductase [Thalassorhabdus alkalitolerans]|uniref:NAD(P)-dependent oxidoreductase n=1 Tax=Thalassorhabdus alkalitolerans TaxID=2282697 RepID=A0ABW0YN61_9BACI